MKKRTTKPSIRIKRVIKRQSLYFLITVAGLLIQNTRSLADEFWIIENPSALVIYDVYEQRLTGTEKSDLSSFSAWHIIENNQTLSDQFTSAVKTVYNRKTYFFQSSTDGQLAGKAGAGKIEKFIHAQTLNDTVRVIKNNRLSLKSSINRYPLAKGTVLHRIFQTKKKIYVRNLTDRVSGWVEGDSKKNWEFFRQDINETALEDRLFLQIDQIFQSYNTRFAKLFNYLNKKNQPQHPSPRWVGTASTAHLSYQIEPAVYRESFQGSQRFLLQELSDLLYGSNYGIKEDNERIIISKFQH